VGGRIDEPTEGEVLRRNFSKPPGSCGEGNLTRNRRPIDDHPKYRGTDEDRDQKGRVPGKSLPPSKVQTTIRKNTKRRSRKKRSSEEKGTTWGPKGNQTKSKRKKGFGGSQSKKAGTSTPLARTGKSGEKSGRRLNEKIAPRRPPRKERGGSCRGIRNHLHQKTRDWRKDKGGRPGRKKLRRKGKNIAEGKREDPQKRKGITTNQRLADQKTKGGEFKRRRAHWKEKKGRKRRDYKEKGPTNLPRLGFLKSTGRTSR